jgi:sugar O-acyltransferase (sialic acid O-acetyltransferase NeuD family)
MPDSKPLLIFPYNGNALEALDCLAPHHHLLAFVDDTPEKQGEDRYGNAVLGRSAFREFPNARVLAVPGAPHSYRARRAIVQGLDVDPERYARVVHPSARISPLARIGHNVLIMAGVVITGNALIGDHVCILPNSVIHHDAIVGDWSLIGSQVSIAGAVRIGTNCYIASGSTIMNGLHVGDGALIGLGSNVIRDVPAEVRVAGNPARVLAERTIHAN